MSPVSPPIVWRRDGGWPGADGRRGEEQVRAPARGFRCLWAVGHLEGEPADRSEIERRFARHGAAAAERCHGAVSWVIWDGERRRLVAVADRMGSHRIYWHEQGPEVALAPTVEGLLPRLEVRPALDRESIVAHVHGRAPALDRSHFRDIRAVPPGAVLTIGENAIETRRYWRPELAPVHAADDAGHARRFRERLQEVVEEYLPAARFGISLSGGLDSTSVAAAAAVVARDRALAYRWQAPDLPEADESTLSASVSRRLGLTDRPIDAGRHWTLSSPEGARTGRSSPYRGYFDELWEATLERVAGDGVGVLLTGAGGDHLVGGNVFGYPDLLLTGRWLELGRQLRRHLGRSESGWWRVAKRMIVAPIVAAWAPGLLPRPRPVPWLADGLAAPARRLRRRWALPGRVQRLRVMGGPRVAQVLEATAAQAARHGIDLRHPLFDDRLVELALSLPTDQTFRAGVRKIVVRNALAGELPEEVLGRRLKIYPEAISRRGLAERETAKVEALLDSMRAQELGFVDARRLRAEYRDYVAGRHQRTAFWYALTLEDWLRRYF